MGNKNNKEIIRIYGVTLADKGTRPYGHGMDEIEIDGKMVMIEYVDYFIDDLVALIKKYGLEKKIIKRLLTMEKKENE